jgi:membrane-bound metal-dependent hydrolase YbcI (DUF457 family)
MTFPEHLVCSVLIANLGAQQRLGWKVVPYIAMAGVAPDLDAIGKVLYEPWFWKYHHAIGHCLIALAVIATITATCARYIHQLSFWQVWLFAFLAAFVHTLTDSLYFWGIAYFWPWRSFEPSLGILKYLDLVVLTIWLVPAVLLYRYPHRAGRIATMTFVIFVTYIIIRAALPAPTGILGFLTGDWILAPPQQTPVIDWW